MKKPFCLSVAAAVVCLLLSAGAALAQTSDLRIVSIDDNPADVTRGQGSVTYTVVVSNAAGSTTATTVVLTNTIPASSAYVTSTANNGGTCTDLGGGQVSCTWPTLAVSASVSATITVTPGAGGANTFTASVDGDQDDPLPGNNTDSETTTVNNTIDLQITDISDIPTDITVGQPVTYTITLFNASTSKATSPALTVFLPSGSTFGSSSATASGHCAGTGPLVCTWFEHPPGDTRTVTIVVTPAAGFTMLSAQYDSDQGDPNSGNNSASEVTTVNSTIDLQVTGISDSPTDITLGQGNVTYTITLANGSTSVATSTRLTVDLPASSTYVSSSATNSGTCVQTLPGVVRCTWDTHEAYVGASAFVVVTPGAGGTNTLSATYVSLAQGDPDSANNSQSETTTVNATIDLQVTDVSDSPTDIALGQGNVTYTIDLANGSTSAATNTVLTATLPASSTYVSSSPTVGGTCSEATAGVVTCNWATHNAGGTHSATIVVRPDADGTNTLTVSYASSVQDDPNLANNSGSETTTVSANPAPVVTAACQASYTERQAVAPAIDPALTVTDVDSATLAGATVTISAGFASGDTLNFANQGAITGSYDAGTHVLTLTGGDTIANYQTALRSVTFSSTSHNPDGDGTNLTRAITWQVDDGSVSNNLSSAQFTTIAITAVNDPPTLDAIGNRAVIAPGAGEQTVDLTGISAGVGESQSLSITATSDNLGLIPDPAVNHTGADTTGSLTYTPVADAVGTAIVTVTISDGGGGTETVVQTFTVTVCHATAVVTSADDSGAGSLRQAIAEACAGGTVTFAPAVTSIALTSGELAPARDVIVSGPGAATLTITRDSNASLFRIFHVTEGRSFAISGVTISNGFADNPSGGWDVYGGGIFAENGTTVTVTASAIIANAAGYGGGISSIALANPSSLTIVDSTISGNTAWGDGGGIEVSGMAGLGGASLSMTNSTVSGNEGGSAGGGLSLLVPAATLTNVTITNNTLRFDVDDPSAGGGGVFAQAGASFVPYSLVLRNTIVAANAAVVGSDIAAPGVDSSSSANLIGDSAGFSGMDDGVNGNLVGVDPLLGPLADNGGPTQTHALLQGSPAIDAGINTFVVAPPFTNVTPIADQRGAGFRRVADGPDSNPTATVDIGAFEADPTVADIADTSTSEDTPLSFTFQAGDVGSDITVTATSNNQTLAPDASLVVTGGPSSSTQTLTITPGADLNGTATITVTVTKTVAGTLLTASDSFLLTVTSVADTPSVTNAATTVNDQTTSGLAITANAADSDVAYFKITSVTAGALFQNDGVTPIANDDLITVAEGNAGLRFTPELDSTVSGGFSVQSALDALGTGLSGSAAATITVDKHTTTTVIASADPNPSDQTQQITVAFTVVSADGGPTPTGNVTITASGGTEQCTDSVSTGWCSLTLTTAGVDRTLTATYAGDAVALGSSGTALHTVNACDASTVVTSNADSGPGTLRQALLDTCYEGTIEFDMTSVLSPIGLTSGPLVMAKSVLIEGPGADQLTIHRASGTFRIASVRPGVSAGIGGLTLANGDATTSVEGGGGGGAIYNAGILQLAASELVGNTANWGGAVYNDDLLQPSLLLMFANTLRGNTAAHKGGGLFHQGGSGSGIVILDTNTISGNAAGTDGGGLYAAGADTFLVILGSTITNNRADKDSNGHGIGGGVWIDSTAGRIAMANTIVAGNFVGAGTEPDDASAVLDETAAFFNLIGVDANLTLINDGSNLVGTVSSPIDPRLGPLANHGGATLTHVPLPGSPALDAGANDLLSFISCGCFDQRGLDFVRIRTAAGGNASVPTADIGAVEADPTIAVIAGKVTNEDTALAFGVAVGDAETAFDSIVATSSDQALVPDANLNVTGTGATRTLTLAPAANLSGVAMITVTVTKTIAGTVLTAAETFTLAVQPVADTPSITSASTGINAQTTSGLVVSRHPADGTAVTHVQVTNISGGTLFQHDGVTPIVNGSFITIAEGAAGLRFTPATDSVAVGHVTIQASTSGLVAGLAGGTATADITVSHLVSTTAVATSGSPSVPGQSVTFTATVSPAQADGGTVQFMDGTTPLGVPVTVSGGVAMFSTTTLATGEHTISAIYSGNTLCQGSTGTLAGGQTVRTPGRRPLLTGADAGGAPRVRRFMALDGSVPPIGALSSFLAFDASFSGGVRVAEGDLDGDGVPDYIAGAGPGGAPEVRIVDGATGALRASFAAFEPEFRGGVFVAAGDVNGDGYVDVVVGSGEGRTGDVKVFSGRDLATLLETAVFPGFTGGVRVAAGDVNGDGLADLVAGTGAGAATVTVLNAVDLSVLRTFIAYPGFTGGVWVAAGDVTGDGYADVVTGAGAGGGPHVRVFDGRTGVETHGFFAFAPGFAGGVRVAAGDVNGDGHAEIIAAAGPGGPADVRVIDPVTTALLNTVVNDDGTSGVFVATAVPVSRMAIDTPVTGATVASSFTLSGWAFEESMSDAGIAGIDVVAIPVGSGAAIALGAATIGGARPDVGAIYGTQYANAGFHLVVSGLAPGVYDLRVTARSAVTGAANLTRTVRVTVGADPQPVLAIDIPAAGPLSSGDFAVAGWALTPGTLPAPGVDAIHMWAAPVGGGAWRFLGAAVLGVPRPDVAIAFGSPYAAAGYYLTVTGLPPGTWDVHVFPRATGRAAFAAARVVRVTVPGGSTRSIITGADAGGGPHVTRFAALAGGPPAVGALSSFFAFDPFFTGGVRVAEGDVTGDGVPDYIAGAGPGGAPEIRVIDGATGTIRASIVAFEPEFRGGVFVAAGDVNGDGFVDVIAGSGVGRRGQIKVYSGRDASLLRDGFVFDATFRGGVHVAAGDVNGDGYADPIAGPGAGGTEVTVLNATDLSVLWTVTPFPGFFGGAFVAGGDVTGDGFADVITGAGPGGSPHVRVFDGRGGVEATNFLAYEGEFSGGVRVAVGDVTGDGRAEIIAGPGPGRAPEARVFDAATTARLSNVLAYTSGFTGGVFVATTVPVNRMAIDTPARDATVHGTFALAGWAFDEHPSHAGLDAIHVWAFPVAGGSPIFGGVAALGGPRPDVAAIYGAQYVNAGFSVDVAGLAPGVYDIVLFGHSAVSGTFNLQRAVRVTVTP